MKNKKYWVLTGTLAVFAVIIRLFSSDSMRVEQYYSNGVYLYISFFLRLLFGWLPFSLGDVLYGLAAFYLLFKFLKGIVGIFKGNFFSRGLLRGIQTVLVTILAIYIIFNVFWGINYNRMGIASQLGLQMEKYSVAELTTLNSVLLQKVNASKNGLLQHPSVVMNSKELFNHSMAAYKVVHDQYPFLNYYPPSIKTSLWGWLGNYTGFLGYYNPFTAESQVNTTVPVFLQPFVDCHEIAHQLGYAKENEANFVGYLAAAASSDESFHYSVYLDLFLYANRNLYSTDSTGAKVFSKNLLPAVKEDLKVWRHFDLSHKNPVEPYTRWAYGKYLESNQQPSGVLSYDEVTGFMIAYYKKFGKL